MRTQLRRQAAAHTDHVRDVLKVQEQELKAEAEQVFTSVTSEMTDELTILSSNCYKLHWRLTGDTASYF